VGHTIVGASFNRVLAIEWGRQAACAIRFSRFVRHGLHPTFSIPCPSALAF